MNEGFLDSYGYKVHYVRWKREGPNLLLIHSMGMDAHSMDQLAENLTDYNILSLTILGHGDSSQPSTHLPLDQHAEIMRNCYRQLNHTPTALIGHSVGGMMGMILAAEYPNEITRLVLVDIAPFELTGRPSRPQPPESFKTEAEARAYLKERYPLFTESYYDNRIKYAFTERDGKLYLKPTGDTVRTGLAVDLWPYVEHVKAPTLLLIGAESTLVSPETRRRMEKTVPSLKAVTVHGADHMIPQDVPETFEKHILNLPRATSLAASGRAHV